MSLTPEQTEIIALHRRLGEAEGLLIGWLYVDHTDAAHLVLARAVTQRFIDDSDWRDWQQPTHWMPLPSPPAIEAKESQP